MKHIKVNELTKLTDTPYLNMYLCDYKNRLGQSKQWVIASRKEYEVLSKQFFGEQREEVDAVVVVAHHEPTKKLVVIKQFRIPLNDYIYELPAGLIDPGEEMPTAVARELKEETGLTLKAIDYDKSLMKTYLSPGMSDESVSLVYCTCEGEITNKYAEADEDITPFLISKKEARELLKGEEKIDIKLFMALQQFIIE